MLLQKGLFTNAYATKMGFQNGECPECRQIPKTIKHILWLCRKAKQRMDFLISIYKVEPCPISLLEWIDRNLQGSKQNPALLTLIAKYSFFMWKERNESQFCHRIVHMPPSAILKEALLEIEAIPRRYTHENTLAALTSQIQPSDMAASMHKDLGERTR
ncbi:hypothetical protein R1flu_022634 [Riccia fluitans]|uniref:Reverse transcriptase zinc-binding domain-containing protein n=1 Tax=Riccia fluitans TaxID=41844 RepID=A0ABD1XPR1_9MARC